MSANLPLSMILEVAIQRAKSQKQVDYCLTLMQQIERLESCYAAESADR